MSVWSVGCVVIGGYFESELYLRSMYSWNRSHIYTINILICFGSVGFGSDMDVTGLEQIVLSRVDVTMIAMTRRLG